jgi:phosphate transport system protein
MADGTTGCTARGVDGELSRLRGLLSTMAFLADRQVLDATAALLGHDAPLAAEVVDRDPWIDRLEREVSSFCVRLLALRQPLAADLRLVVAAMRVGHDLERIGDHAASAARRAVVLAGQPKVGSLNGFGRLAGLVSANLAGAMDALDSGDAACAAQVWASDAAVDGICNGIFRELLTHMMEDPQTVTAAAHLLFVAKSLERIGDLSADIAEAAHYVICGAPPPGDRPKADSSAYAVVRPRQGKRGGRSHA